LLQRQTLVEQDHYEPTARVIQFSVPVTPSA